MEVTNASFLNDTERQQDNDSLMYDNNDGEVFFNVYFSVPRFATETTLAVASALVNITMIVCIYRAKTQSTGTVYNALFVNLVIANICNCCVSWLSNNFLVLFEMVLLELVFYGKKECTFYVFLMGLALLQNACAIVSTLTMLGFATVQYIAICAPMEHLHCVRRKRLICFIALSWSLSLTTGALPFLALLVVVEGTVCTADLKRTIFRTQAIGSNISIALVAAVFFSVITLCCRIYSEVRKLQKRLSRFRFDQDVDYERKVFVTTVILLLTLSFFTLPYTIIYVVSLNQPKDAQGAMKSSMIYYMMLLPYLKYLSDPIIYGTRMTEVRQACVSLSSSCGLAPCPCFRDKCAASTSVLQRTNSIQLKNITAYPPSPL